jgi:hypothetical protein
LVLYVRGEEDKFWHYCKNCKAYPAKIIDTTITEPEFDLCPECFENESKNNCEGKPSESVGTISGLI